MLPGRFGHVSVSELRAVWRWSAGVMQSRLVRWLAGDTTLPRWCNACVYLFRPSRLPTPFEAAERYLPKFCNCTGHVGCKFPRGGPGQRNNRLEFCRTPVEIQRSRPE